MPKKAKSAVLLNYKISANLFALFFLFTARIKAGLRYAECGAAEIGHVQEDDAFLELNFKKQ